MGDAGWAGVLAETFIADPKRLVYLVFQPGMNLLPLFAEAEALLPPEERWEIGFNSYYTSRHRASVAPGSESWPTLPNSPKAASHEVVDHRSDQAP